MIMRKLKVLELFAGERCMGKAFEKKGHEVISVDWGDFEGIHLRMDINDLHPTDLPFIPDVVHGSFDCTTYTIAAISTHRRNRTEPYSEYAKKCDAVNQHVISLIDFWLENNPDLKFTIENPRGVLRHMPWMQRFKRETVWYCQYGDDRAKPTDIFHNLNYWTPRPECRNYKYDKEGNIIDQHCHHASARRGARTGTQGRKGSVQRSLIPEQLCEEIVRAAEHEIIELPQLEMEYRLDL